jgi:lactoylglutathione lyase
MRIAHTMIRVKDLEKSVEFYIKALDMKEFSRKDYEEGKFTLVFVGYENMQNQPAIELTYNWGEHDYELGSGFGHIALEVNNVYHAYEKVVAAGGKGVREPGPMKHGSSVIAFVEDPDGYKIELVGMKD